MCKFIKDILFPLNVLGKKMQVIKYKLPSGNTPVAMTISFTGERLISMWTRIDTTWAGYVQVDGIKDVYANSEAITPYMLYRSATVAIQDDIIYFRCTNITSLIVNGETLI